LRSIAHALYVNFLGGISDSIIWFDDQFATNNEKYKAFAIPANGKFDTLAFIPNEHYGITISGRQGRYGNSLTQFFYQYNT